MNLGMKSCCSPAGVLQSMWMEKHGANTELLGSVDRYWHWYGHWIGEVGRYRQIGRLKLGSKLGKLG